MTSQIDPKLDDDDGEFPHQLSRSREQKLSGDTPGLSRRVYAVERVRERRC